MDFSGCHLVRGYGIQLMPFCPVGDTIGSVVCKGVGEFAAQAGAVVTIGPPNDLMTADWMSEILGNTTIWQYGSTVGQGTNAQGGVNLTDGLNYGQAERRFLLPQELRSMEAGTDQIWTPGNG